MNNFLTIQEWARKYFSDSISLHKINSGINNQVYIVQDGWQPCYSKTLSFLKTYPDRFSAECDLLTLANRLSPKNAPKLLKQDKSNRIMILEFINGEPYNQKNLPTMKDIEGAALFLQKN